MIWRLLISLNFDNGNISDAPSIFLALCVQSTMQIILKVKYEFHQTSEIKYAITFFCNGLLGPSLALFHDGSNIKVMIMCHKQNIWWYTECAVTNYYQSDKWADQTSLIKLQHQLTSRLLKSKKQLTFDLFSDSNLLLFAWLADFWNYRKFKCISIFGYFPHLIFDFLIRLHYHLEGWL